MSDVDAKPLAIDSIPCVTTLSLSPSLRGAKRRSNPALSWLDGLLRFARNDAFNHVHTIIVAVVAAGSPRPCGVAPAQSLRAARRDRRCGWQGSEPAPYRDRRFVRRSIRDAPRRPREMRLRAWRNSKWSTMP